MSTPIRVGLIGYGFASKTFHAPLIDGVAGMDLTAVSSRDPAKVHADWPGVAVVGDPQAIFDDPDIDLVIIPTPNDTHFPLAQAALIAGKHVVVDKPFTLTLEEAKTLEKLAKHHGRLLSVFHNRRWDSDFLTLKKLFAQDKLGDVVYFESHFDRYRPQVRDRWREKPGQGSGIWYDLAPHLIDQAITLFGLPVSIDVDLAQLRNGAEATDYFHAILAYPKLRVVLHGTVLSPATTPRFIVQGMRGGYIKYGLDPQEDNLKAGVRRSAAPWGVDTVEGRLTLAHGEVLETQSLPTEDGNYFAYYEGIRDALLGAGENPVTATQAINVMRLIELGMLSAQKHQSIKLHD